MSKGEFLILSSPQKPPFQAENLVVKGQRVNILGLMHHVISVTAIELCYCSPKAVTDKT